MEIIQTAEDSGAMLSLKGSLDVFGAEQLKEAIEKLGANVRDLVLDFEEVSSVETMGLREVLNVQKIMRKRGSLSLIRVPEAILDAFRRTGLAERLNIILS